MSRFVRVAPVFLCVTLGSATALAQAPTASSAYDGQYVGNMALSQDLNWSMGNGRANCDRGPFQKSLTIQQGQFSFPYNSTYNVNVIGIAAPDGTISGFGNSSAGGTKLTARIAGSELVGTVGSAYCIYTLQLRKVISAANASGGPSLTVQQLLAAGGRKLLKTELLQIYPNSTISGIQIGKPDVTFQIKNDASGSVSGNAWGINGWSTRVNGTWVANDADQICIDLVNSQGAKIVGCNYYFVMSNRYYASRGSEPSAVVYERQISR